VCFSATANFVGSGVLAGIGIATMREVKHRRELLFASLPLLFAVHQFTEGFVWLGLDHMASAKVLKDAGAAYILYAQGLLPFLMPLSVLLLEPMVRQRRRMIGFLALGTVLAVYILWGLIAYPVDISVKQNSIVYWNVVSTTTLVAALYVGATCGALFFSGFKDLVVLAWLNLGGLLVVMEIRRYAFTSVWCAYAAAVSAIIIFSFGGVEINGLRLMR
jgi:hypothetical protein